MLRPCMTQIATHGESYYSIVIGIAKRAREIAQGLADNNQTLEEKPVKTAVDEFAARRFAIVEDPAVKPTKSTDAAI